MAADLAEQIARRCEQPRQTSNGWMACCPAHEDTTPSLSITPGRDKVLLKCHAGCTFAQVVAALGMQPADLFTRHSSPARRAPSTKRYGPIEAIYDYHDSQGHLLHQTVRYRDPKDFSQRQPHPSRPGRFLGNLQGIQPVLYHLPEVLAAVGREETIYVAEGEKDVDALRALGLVATCNPMGAGNWHARYNETLRGAHVRLLPDHDTPGWSHMQRIAHALAGTAADIKVVTGLSTATPGSDVSDWLAAGGTREGIEATVAQMPWYTSTPSDEGPGPPAGRAATPPTGRLEAPLRVPEERALPYGDVFNARLLVETYGTALRYCEAWKSWLAWSGTHWVRDSTGETMRLAKQTMIAFLHDARAQLEQVTTAWMDLAARTERDEESVRTLRTQQRAANTRFAHAAKSLNHGPLTAMVKQAQSEPGIAVTPAVFDTHLWSLNVLNGTLDLRTGTLHPHEPSAYLTRCLEVAYLPDAPCLIWERFLWRIMGGSPGDDDPDMSLGELAARQAAETRARTLIGFLHRAIGYSLTGDTTEQCLFILHGPTKTGKSTFLETIGLLLGDYAQQAEMSTFLHKDNDQVRNDLADLAGARFVSAVEVQEGKRLAESLVKQLSGSDRIKARFLFQEYFTYTPQFKVFLGTNHKPVIRDTDDAIWERIRLVPFTVQIPKDARDTRLLEKLHGELPGILAWAVQGCLAWQKHGLHEPEAVELATRGYRHEMDHLGQFLDDACLIGPSYHVKAHALYDAYKDWCTETAQDPLTGTMFGKRLNERGFTTGRDMSSRWRQGIGVKDWKNTPQS